MRPSSILALAVLCIGCGAVENSAPAPGPTVVVNPDGGGKSPDAGTPAEPDPEPSDSGTPTNDSGAPANDSGTPANDSGMPVNTPESGPYFASCLSELAAGSVAKTFSFWANVKVTRAGTATTGGTIAVIFEALAIVGGKPPPIVTRAGITGTPTPIISGSLDTNDAFLAKIEAGTSLTIPGLANPISGSDVLLTNEGVNAVGLRGRFAKTRFCTRLVGHVAQPAAAARDLDVDKNFCIFTPTKDGAAAPPYTFGDYSVANCPL